MFDNILIGLIIFPRTLTRETFLEFLRDERLLLLEEVSLLTRLRMILQMDGCPAHYALIVRSFLNENYPRRWIGRQGPVGWPARSPDLTPLEYFLWGTMKQRVYSSLINSEVKLKRKSLGVANEIRNDPEIIRRVTQQIVHRATMCLQQRGDRLKH
ncbi:unnamed protein product [Euphydryas editha]|uniref:Tc1-like transposase DDE domain-containing protein n=1 Tax=Euphydryas editha TaxID=104508 RepID=A0AAU9UET8_EUPED|nr:unnamed protein product [Euphydryas editha]